MSKTTDDEGEDGRLDLDVYKAALDFTLATSRDTWTRGPRGARRRRPRAPRLHRDARSPLDPARRIRQSHVRRESCGSAGSRTRRPLVGGVYCVFRMVGGNGAGFRYQDHYLEFAKRIEEKLFPKGRQLLIDGAETKMGFPSCLRGRRNANRRVHIFLSLRGCSRTFGLAVPSALRPRRCKGGGVTDGSTR
jgi:hypothetical protein